MTVMRLRDGGRGPWRLPHLDWMVASVRDAANVEIAWRKIECRVDRGSYETTADFGRLPVAAERASIAYQHRPLFESTPLDRPVPAGEPCVLTFEINLWSGP